MERKRSAGSGLNHEVGQSIRYQYNQRDKKKRWGLPFGGGLIRVVSGRKGHVPKRGLRKRMDDLHVYVKDDRRNRSNCAT